MTLCIHLRVSMTIQPQTRALPLHVQIIKKESHFLFCRAQFEAYDIIQCHVKSNADVASTYKKYDVKPPVIKAELQIT